MKSLKLYLLIFLIIFNIFTLISCGNKNLNSSNSGDDPVETITIMPDETLEETPDALTVETMKGEDKMENSKIKINLTSVYTVKEPVAGSYPQGLYKYPYRQNSLSENMFLQTLSWSPAVEKTFEKDTQYTAVLTLTPAHPIYTFEGVNLDGVKGIPESGVFDISSDIIDESMVIKIVFEKTAPEYAEPKLVFYDDFEGDKLDKTKWDICPTWDRQGRSTWSDEMVSLSDGYLHLGLKKDMDLGKTKTSDSGLANNWIRAGGVRSRMKGGNIIFENTFGYYEARMKLPKISGTWGAFWLMSPTQHILTDEGTIGTEIDIIESIANPKNKYNCAIHWNGYGTEHKAKGSGEISVVDIYDGEFHNFGFEWSPKEYIFYVDDVEIWRCDGGAAFSNSGINQNPNYIKLTVEGAGFAGNLPADFTEGEVLVDYVKVYDQPIHK